MPEGLSRSGYANWGSFIPHVSVFIRIGSAVTRVSLLVYALRARVRGCFCGINREQKTIRRRKKDDESGRVFLAASSHKKKGDSNRVDALSAFSARCCECARVLRITNRDAERSRERIKVHPRETRGRNT